MTRIICNAGFNFFYLLGFKLGSLNRIIDTKSSSNSKITLLHYLIMVLERKVSLPKKHFVWRRNYSGFFIFYSLVTMLLFWKFKFTASQDNICTSVGQNSLFGHKLSRYNRPSAWWGVRCRLLRNTFSTLQYPEVLKLEEELANVRTAAKVKWVLLLYCSC